MRALYLFFILLLFTLISYSEDPPATLQEALTQLCQALYDYVSMVAFAMILLSSIVYSLGNFFGAETRARANVWATSMLTGAIIGILLIVIVPGFIATILGYKSFNPDTCEFAS